MSDAGKKNTTPTKVPDWEAELWSYVGRGDGVRCPLRERCPTVRKSHWCPDDNRELTTRILGLMEDWAQNNPGKYEKLMKNFGPLFKTGLNSDFANRDKILKLLRFESTAAPKGDLVSLDDYVSRMKKKQKEIYYITGESRAVIEKNPNLEYFRKNDYEVLLLTDPVDIFIIPSINEYEKKPLKSIEKADIDLAEDKKEPEGKKEESLGSDMLDALIKVFKETLGDRVADVKSSKRLVDSPVTLVVGKDGLDPQMERMMKLMNQEVTPQKKILEINPAHPIIKNLSRRNIGSSTDPILRKTIMQLYESALLIEGSLDKERNRQDANSRQNMTAGAGTSRNMKELIWRRLARLP